jgi:hypothetical protein
MHGEQKVGHLAVKESGFPPVYYMTNYFFYHGERFARIKLKNKSINGMIEFYNDELPIAVNEEDDKIVTLTRYGYFYFQH